MVYKCEIPCTFSVDGRERGKGVKERKKEVEIYSANLVTVIFPVKMPEIKLLATFNHSAIVFYKTFK